MKILYFNYMDITLATLIRSFELARAAANCGHTVTLCYLAKQIYQPSWFFDMIDKAQSDRFRILIHRPVRCESVSSAGGKLTSLGLLRRGLGSLRYIPTEIKFILRYQPDVVVARPDYSLSFLVSSFIAGRPLVLCTDGPVEEIRYFQGLKWRWPVAVDLWRMRKAQSVIYISDVCGNLLRKKNIIPNRLFACPNGADPEVFRPGNPGQRQTLRASLGIGPETMVIGFSGNQRFWHGLQVLLRELPEFLTEHPSSSALIIGALEESAGLGLDRMPAWIRQKHLIMTGSVDYQRMPEYLDCTDIVVMPYPSLTIFHFSPMKLFEAMAMGKVIVASSQGQIGNVLWRSPAAFLYRPDDHKGLVRSLGLAAAAVGSNKELGMENRRLLCEQHSWHHRGESWIRACEYAAAKRKIVERVF